MSQKIIQVTLCTLFTAVVALGQSPIRLTEQIARLTAADGEIGDSFGRALSISGDTVIVGAYSDGNDGGNRAGAAYIFERNQGGLDNWGQVAKLTASDAAANDWFGFSVSVSGSTAIVGANGHLTGVAYIFERDQGGTNNWGQVAKISASDAAASDLFGESVSVSGDIAIVGAPSADHTGNQSAGTAYIFERDQGGPGNWGQVARVIASDAGISKFFGFTVSLSGETAIVGAYQAFGSGAVNTGSAYIFERDQGGLGNWGQTVRITAADAEAGDQFGYSVSISGDIALVGAHDENDGAGAAYIFERDHGGADNWGQTAKIVSSDGGMYDAFGRTVSLSGTTAIIGAPKDSYVAPVSGSAYIFERDQGGPSNWGQMVKIAPDDASAYARFSNPVAINGQIAVVGSPFASEEGEDFERAYIFAAPSEPVPTCPCLNSSPLFADFIAGTLELQMVFECRDAPDLVGLHYLLTDGSVVGAMSRIIGSSLSQCGTRDINEDDYFLITPEEDEICREFLRRACPL